MSAAPNALIARLLHPTQGVGRGLLKTDHADKLIKIRVGELRDIASGLAQLDAECERAWKAYRIAHDQAVANGSALQTLRAGIAGSSPISSALEGGAETGGAK